MSRIEWTSMRFFDSDYCHMQWEKIHYNSPSGHVEIIHIPSIEIKCIYNYVFDKLFTNVIVYPYMSDVILPHNSTLMKHIIEQVFRDVLENPVFDLSCIEKYFSKDYVQWVDRHQLNYKEFILHIKKLKEKVAEQKIEILTYAENGNIIFTHHLAKSVLKDGNIVLHKVLAEFTIEENKIIKCDELTLLLEGIPHAGNLGSEI